MRSSYIKPLKKYFYIFTIALIALGSCDDTPTVVIPETSKSTENSLLAISEIISTFDVVEDFVSSSQLFLKRDEALMPADAEITILDGEFKDGDGMEAVIDFGAKGLEPYGLLCKDNKYRAGKIYISLDKPYSEIDAKLTLRFDKEEPFFSGDGTQMSEIVGSVHVKRISNEELLLHCGELTVATEDKGDVSIVANLSVQLVEDKGVGLVNDKLSFDGVLEVESLEEELTFNIIEPLQKDYALSCAQYIKEGRIDVEPMNSASEISIDFDPNNNTACDKMVGITVNGRTFIYEY